VHIRRRTRPRNKGEVERFYANKIVRAFAPSASFLTMGNANLRQPDVLFAFGERLLGIELTGTYYSQRHAQDVNSGRRPSPGQQAANVKFSFENSEKLAPCKIRESIERKAENRYQEIDEVFPCADRRRGPAGS